MCEFVINLVAMLQDFDGAVLVIQQLIPDARVVQEARMPCLIVKSDVEDFAQAREKMISLGYIPGDIWDMNQPVDPSVAA